MKELERYLDRKLEIITEINKGKSYSEVLESLNVISSENCLSFIYAIEEKNKVKIRTKEQLIKYIGLQDTEVIDTLIEYCNDEAYNLALEECWIKGGKYKDLFNIKKEDYSIKGVNSKGLKLTKEKALATFIGIKYNFLEINIFRPELRVIAKDLEAPYSVILKIYLEF